MKKNKTKQNKTNKLTWKYSKSILNNFFVTFYNAFSHLQQGAPDAYVFPNQNSS